MDHLYDCDLLQVTIGHVVEQCVGEAARMVEEETNKDMDSILLTPPATDPDSPVNECKDNIDNVQVVDPGVFSDSINSIISEDSKTDSLDMVCKWTNCDWPGIHDDLVDHIREIHVELQPYHNHRDIVSSPTAFSSISSHRASKNLDRRRDQPEPPQHQYVCLWEGCKVYGKGSLSRSWIERHVLQHSGPRPFKCIVEGCNERFKKREALERHVNNHFNLPISELSSLNCSSSLPNVPSEDSNIYLNNDNNSNDNNSNENDNNDDNDTNNNNINSNSSNSNKNRNNNDNNYNYHYNNNYNHNNDQLTHLAAPMSTKGHHNGQDLNSNLSWGSVTPNKLLKRKKMNKAKKKFFNVKAREDYFDDGIMDIIKYRLMEFSMLTGLDIFGNQSDVVFHSKIIGRCCSEKDGSIKVLVHWEPEGIMPDEWILESDLKEDSCRKVPLNLLPIDSLIGLFDEKVDNIRRGRKYKRN